MKLDIGSGTAPIGNGYTSVDLYQEDAEIKAPMWALPVEAGIVDAIWCSHALEHVGWQQIQPTLAEWRRVLKPGATLTLRVPDLEWCVNHWCEHRDDPWALAKIFGSQEHDGNTHRCGYDEAGWKAHLETAGFRVDAVHRGWSHEQATLEYVCTRPL